MIQISIKGARGYYEVYADGNFICSCDTLREVDEELSCFDEFEIV